MHLSFVMRAGFAVVACAAIVRRGISNKSLDITGGIAAVFVGFFLTLSNLCHFAVCIAMFLTSSKITKFKSEAKKRLEDDFKEGGQRNWIQVFCNGGIPTVLACIYVVDIGVGERPIDYAKDYNASVLSIAILASFACSCGDTWASEIGTVMGSQQPVLITTFRKVRVGTNGGITVIGTIASILGGTVIGIAFYVTLYVTVLIRNPSVNFPPQWPVVLIGSLGGFVGSMIDSFLGATVQYSGYCTVKKLVVHRPTATTQHISGIQILDNHAVNFVSALFTSILMPMIGFFLWKSLI